MRASARDAFALATAPTISLQCELAGLVSFAALNQKTPPAFLYTSGKAVVIFRASLAPGDVVEVIGPDDASLDRWTGRDASGEEPGGRS